MWTVDIAASGARADQRQLAPKRRDLVGTARRDRAGRARWIAHLSVGCLCVARGWFIVSGFPVAFRTHVTALLTIADLDGDAASSCSSAFLRGLPSESSASCRWRGRAFGWPVELDSNPLGSAAVGDVDGDGTIEIAHLSEGALALRSADATPKAGFPIAPDRGHLFDGAVVFADLDGDRPGLELVVGDRTESATPGRPVAVRLWAFDAMGTPLPGYPIAVSDEAAGLEAPVIGDLEGDGVLEIVVPVIGDGIVIVRPRDAEPTTKITHIDLSASVMLDDVDG